MLRDSEQLLRQTFGYITMRNDPDQQQKAKALLDATHSYASRLAKMPEGTAELADSTGFSPEGVRAAMVGIGSLENKLTESDWTPQSLFGQGGRMADLFGVMLKVPQLKQELIEIGRSGNSEKRISEITKDWVNGKSLESIAQEYFHNEKDDDVGTRALTDACRAIYRTIVNSGTWGVSALSRVSGIDFDRLSESEKRRMNALPAMIYHGVSSEDAVVMRMNSAPRSAAEALGDLYREVMGEDEERYSVGKARRFLRNLQVSEWEKVRPKEAPLSGSGYKQVWQILSGEAS